MTLDINRPYDSELVAQLPYWIRASRRAINTFESSIMSIAFTTLNLGAGVNHMDVGTLLSVAEIEFIRLSASGAAPIANILGGTQGQMKVFIFQDNNVSFEDGTKSLGALYLNQLPALSTFNAAQDDVIALINMDGNGSGVDGYWKELFRQISVK